MSKVSWVPSGSETSACCCGCTDSETLEITFYDIAPCACGGNLSEITAFSGLLGTTHTVTLTAPMLWAATVGSYTRKFYPDTCGVGGTTVSGNFRIIVTCSDGVYSVVIDLGDLTANIFFAGDVPIGVDTNNDITCDGAYVAGGGYVNLNLP